MQHAGQRFTAMDVYYFKNNREAGLNMNIAKAYPEKAMVGSWDRNIILHRGKNVVITEKYVLEKCKMPPAENFLTPLKPDLNKPGSIVLIDTVRNRMNSVHYNSKEFKASKEKIYINDDRMSKIWGHHLYRVVLHSNNHALHASF